jgi:hypothetical protein
MLYWHEMRKKSNVNSRPFTVTCHVYVPRETHDSHDKRVELASTTASSIYLSICICVCWGRFRLGSWGPLHFYLQGSGGVIWIINSWLSASLLQSTPTRRFPKVDWEMRYTEFGRIFPNNVSPPSAKQPKMAREKATRVKQSRIGNPSVCHLLLSFAGDP